jgi:hypothetical protein
VVQSDLKDMFVRSSRHHTREGIGMPKLRKVAGSLALCCVAALLTVSAEAAEFRVTGFFDNIIPNFSGNLSVGDRDVTRNGDAAASSSTSSPATTCAASSPWSSTTSSAPRAAI